MKSQIWVKAIVPRSAALRLDPRRCRVLLRLPERGKVGEVHRAQDRRHGEVDARPATMRGSHGSHLF